MAPKGYPVVAINPNDPAVAEGETFADMQNKASEKGFPFLYLDDTKQTVYPQFGAKKTPHVFLLDQNRVVQYIGAIDDNAQEPEQVEVHYLRNAIAALENGETPNPSTTKAVGCSIKTAKKGNAIAEGKGKGKGRKGPQADRILERLDSDNDQKVSLEEANNKLKDQFETLDANADGFLNLDELGAIKKSKKGNKGKKKGK